MFAVINYLNLRKNVLAIPNPNRNEEKAVDVVQPLCPRAGRIDIDDRSVLRHATPRKQRDYSISDGLSRCWTCVLYTINADLIEAHQTVMLRSQRRIERRRGMESAVQPHLSAARREDRVLPRR